MLEVRDLSYSCLNSSVLHQVSFQAFRGSVCIFLGTSGSGKTTLFRLIAGLLPYSQGKVSWDGVPITKKDVAYMQQNISLLPWRCVLKNLWLVQELGQRSSSREVFSSQLDEIIHNFSLEALLFKFPDELSEGQKQRVALAMQCLTNKDLLLLDEPFSALDLITKEELYQHILSLAKKNNKAVLLITHDVRDILFLGNVFFSVSNRTIRQVDFSSITLSSADVNMYDLINLYKTYISV